jgi:pimeloyl-ACP methyl ester carboxylesterase
MTTYHHLEIDGLNLFYREAGQPNLPTLVLLHGFPSSSHMFRDLIPHLEDRFHVIAPDYPGFGYSDAPSPADFSYTFDHLAEVIEKLIQKLGIDSFALYLQDYGGPVGFRIAARSPQRIIGLIIQNANAYMEGISEAMMPIAKYWSDRAGMESAIRGFLTLETTTFQYTHGANNPGRISPDACHHDQSLLNRSGNDLIQLELLFNYRDNPPLYPEWQEYFRKHQPRTLIVWGRNDPFFTVLGAQAYLRDLPRAELNLLDAGHFALEELHEEIAAYITRFLDETQNPYGR